MKPRLLVLIVAMLAAVSGGMRATAQVAPYKFDIGVQAGMSGYIGDANNANPLKHPGFDGELSMRYLASVRWAFRGVLSCLGLSGNTTDVPNVLPDGQQFDFTSTVYGLDLRAEFNFLPYGIGETYKQLRRISPYLVVGVGVNMASSGGNTALAPTLPMGFGVKYKLGERWNLGAEFTMTKVFGDKVDGLADLNGIKTSFYRNTDWISRLTIGISYEFGKRCETCHYID